MKNSILMIKLKNFENLGHWGDGDLGRGQPNFYDVFQMLEM
jgi:hypothetical protein